MRRCMRTGRANLSLGAPKLVGKPSLSIYDENPPRFQGKPDIAFSVSRDSLQVFKEKIEGLVPCLGSHHNTLRGPYK